MQVYAMMHGPKSIKSYITYKIIMFQCQDAIFSETEIQRFASINTTILVFKMLELQNCEFVDFRIDVRNEIFLLMCHVTEVLSPDYVAPSGGRSSYCCCALLCSYTKHETGQVA